MSKASMIAKMLQEGKTIERYKEAGNSMLPILKSKQPVTLEPVTIDIVLKENDIVFCRVKGNYYTHKITGIRNNQYQISNNRGFVNGWISRDKIFGKVTKIWDK
ncbi:repressor protein [Bacillus phage G]|uniref:Gp89 n=1 Tax=Bacillus phage G TaxID=2884420 RepID=G3MBF7_9CAUD|nr:repressor protein [Bacillus phage G]AEO93357.1 gp89 [Bacillus phage G]